MDLVIVERLARREVDRDDARLRRRCAAPAAGAARRRACGCPTSPSRAKITRVHDFHTFEVAVAVLGGLLVVGALLSGLAKRSFLSLTALFVLVGFALGEGGRRGARVRPRVGLRARARDRRADPDPVPRRARGRGGAAPGGVAPAAAQARLRDAAHRGARRRRDARADRPRLDGVVPARRAALADRSRPLVRRRDQPARAAAHPPLAEPRVRAERRAGAARGAGAAVLARPGRGRLHVVDVRGAGPRRRVRGRRRRRLRRRRG